MIAVDWGSTRLRLYRLDESGAILEQRRHDDGVLSSEGRFGELLAAAIDGWNDDAIVMCGMIGSRNGWHEMPYLDCPADNQALAAGMRRFRPPGFETRELWLVPGLCDTASDRLPDVMRGEETQLAALLDTLPDGTHHACLPGTHSKWVEIRDGHVRRIVTAMTGEVYAVLRRHSVLGKLMPTDGGGFDGTSFDGDAFDAGVVRSSDTGGLLHHLFGVRTAGLFGKFNEDALPSYLSGLLIGHEVRAGIACFPAASVPGSRIDQVQLVGSERLATAYARALAALGVTTRRHPEHLAAHGVHALWRRRTR